MNLNKYQNSPWVLTLPIMLLFALDVLLLGKNVPLSDGIRYWKTASDILNGFSETPVLEGYLLKNGPLYPFLLSIFKFLGFSVKACIYLNALFLYLGFTFFFKTARVFLNKKQAVWITYILVFIDPFLFYWGAKLYSEPLSILLICLAIYYSHNYFQKASRVNLFKISFILCLLILTRSIFAYVFLTLIPIGFLSYFFLKRKVFKNIGQMSVLSLLFCLPYLIFTFTLTNKIFYWSDAGGQLLYWTSSPYKTDLGEWHTLQINHDHFAARYNAFSGLDSLYLRKVNDVIISEINSNHKEFAQSLSGKNSIQRDEAFRQKALQNIKENPKAFLHNWFLNTGRLLVGIPHAMYHKPPFSPFFTLINTIKSSFLLCFLLTAIVLFLGNLNGTGSFTLWLFLILIIYLGGQSILATQSQRFLLPVYPLLLFFIALVFNHTISLKWTKINLS